MIGSPYSRQKKERDVLSLLWKGGIFLWEKSEKLIRCGEEIFVRRDG
jgi:hypothetical protein